MPVAYAVVKGDATGPPEGGQVSPPACPRFAAWPLRDSGLRATYTPLRAGASPGRGGLSEREHALSSFPRLHARSPGGRRVAARGRPARRARGGGRDPGGRPHGRAPGGHRAPGVRGRARPSHRDDPVDDRDPDRTGPFRRGAPGHRGRGGHPRPAKVLAHGFDESRWQEHGPADAGRSWTSCQPCRSS